jgi:N utilization substance protein B
VDQAHHRPEAVLDRLAEIVGDDERLGEPYDEATAAAGMEYARELVSGVLRHREEIDRIIQERAPTWPLAQMSAIDRNVLRLGLYETLHGGAKVPMKAAINEAVEMAKLFGSETSAKFVNGVLGRAVERA